MQIKVGVLVLFSLAILLSGCSSTVLNANVYVHVVDEGGNPVEDAYVNAYTNYTFTNTGGSKWRSMSGSVQASVVTDEKGNASFGTVPGFYAFQVYKGNAYTGVEKEIKTGENNITITLKTDSTPVCGDGVCEAPDEDETTCSEDCAVQPTCDILPDVDRETYNEGDTIADIPGTGVYSGEQMSITFLRIAQNGATGDYEATFELHDASGALVDTQTVASCTDLFNVFRDSKGQNAIAQQVVVKTIAIANTTGMGYVEISKGTDLYTKATVNFLEKGIPLPNVSESNQIRYKGSVCVTTPEQPRQCTEGISGGIPNNPLTLFDTLVKSGAVYELDLTLSYPGYEDAEMKIQIAAGEVKTYDIEFAKQLIPGIENKDIGLYMNFEGGKAEDLSQYKNAVTLTGSPVAVSEGCKGGLCFSVGKGTGIRVNNADKFGFESNSGPSTLMLDVQFSDTTGYNVFGTCPRPKEASRWTITRWGNIIKGTVFDTSIDSKPIIEVGKWYNAALVHDHPSGSTDTTVSLYINGELQGTKTISGTVPPAGYTGYADGTYRIGQDTCWGSHFTGKLDNVTIFSKAFSAEEVARLAQGQSAAPAPSGGRPLPDLLNEELAGATDSS